MLAGKIGFHLHRNSQEYLFGEMFLYLFLNVQFYATEIKTTTENTSFPGATVSAQAFHKGLLLKVANNTQQGILPLTQP